MQYKVFKFIQCEKLSSSILGIQYLERQRRQQTAAATKQNQNNKKSCFKKKAKIYTHICLLLFSILNYRWFLATIIATDFKSGTRSIRICKSPRAMRCADRPEVMKENGEKKKSKKEKEKIVAFSFLRTIKFPNQIAHLKSRAASGNINCGHTKVCVGEVEVNTT